MIHFFTYENPDRIAKLFSDCKDKGRAAFVGYVCACDPDFNTSLDISRSLIDNGVDLLELGVPFSDPLADGLTNQLAAQRLSSRVPAKAASFGWSRKSGSIPKFPSFSTPITI